MEPHGATEATKATKADLCGFRPTSVLRPKGHYVVIHRVTGRPAVYPNPGDKAGSLQLSKRPVGVFDPRV